MNIQSNKIKSNSLIRNDRIHTRGHYNPRIPFLKDSKVFECNKFLMKFMQNFKYCVGYVNKITKTCIAIIYYVIPLMCSQ